MTIHYLVEGDGRTVVLLHAGVADLRMWDQPTAALVAVGRRVVRCDLRGYGSTPLEPGVPYGDAEDVLALVEELGLTSFTLVGASYGGYVAQQVATAVPDQVERLVLVCTAGDLVEPDAGLRAFNRELPVTPEVLAMPVTMIVGAHDFDFFGDTARALVARLPRADQRGGYGIERRLELVELKWAGHLPTLERPDERRKVLLAALAD